MVHPIDLVREAFALAATPTESNLIGPLRSGHYVQIGMGIGFYVPEADFQHLQDKANFTHRVQFLAVDREGNPLIGSREELLDNPAVASGIAWIIPASSLQG